MPCSASCASVRSRDILSVRGTPGQSKDPAFDCRLGDATDHVDRPALSTDPCERRGHGVLSLQVAVEVVRERDRVGGILTGFEHQAKYMEVIAVTVGSEVCSSGLKLLDRVPLLFSRAPPSAITRMGEQCLD